jgi:hypothetical protein
VRLESPMGARREATHAGGGSQPQERHGEAAVVHIIDRGRMTGGKTRPEEVFE